MNEQKLCKNYNNTRSTQKKSLIKVYYIFTRNGVRNLILIQNNKRDVLVFLSNYNLFSSLQTDGQTHN